MNKEAELTENILNMMKALNMTLDRENEFLDSLVNTVMQNRKHLSDSLQEEARKLNVSNGNLVKLLRKDL